MSVGGASALEQLSNSTGSVEEQEAAHERTEMSFHFHADSNRDSVSLWPV